MNELCEMELREVDGGKSVGTNSYWCCTCWYSD